MQTCPIIEYLHYFFLAFDSTTKHFLNTSVVALLVYVYFCVQYSCSGMAYYVHTGVKFWSLFPLLHDSSYYAHDWTRKSVNLQLKSIPFLCKNDLIMLLFRQPWAQCSCFLQEPLNVNV